MTSVSLETIPSIINIDGCTSIIVNVRTEPVLWWTSQILKVISLTPSVEMCCEDVMNSEARYSVACSSALHPQAYNDKSVPHLNDESLTRKISEELPFN